MDEKREPEEGIVLTEAQQKSRSQRSIAIPFGVLVLLFFAVTLVKGPAVLRGMEQETTKETKAPRLTRDALVAAICGFVVVLMVGASYSAVPFYNWFCRTTGFNGTTQVATSAPSSSPLARKIAVRFDANVAPGLSWKFEPEQTEIELNIGQVATVFYTVTNQSARTTTGQAAYNVAPLTVGAYFQKINCFCFTEQTMTPGEKRQMPVVFYVDPSISDNSDNEGLKTITLSYTFYPVHEQPPKPLAASEPDKRKGAV